MSQPTPIPQDALIEATFAPVIGQGSLFCRVIGSSLMALLRRVAIGELSPVNCEIEIGRCTAGDVTKALAGDDRDIRLAVTEEMDVLRRCAMEVLDELTSPK